MKAVTRTKYKYIVEPPEGVEVSRQDLIKQAKKATNYTYKIYIK